jgi:predicted Rdx family selenoprotein
LSAEKETKFQVAFIWPRNWDAISSSKSWKQRLRRAVNPDEQAGWQQDQHSRQAAEPSATVALPPNFL